MDTLDIDDYLRPTFDKFELLNPHGDLTPPSEAPPPIPTVSYARYCIDKSPMLLFLKCPI